MRQAGMSENWVRKKEKNLELLVHWITKLSFLNVLLLSLHLSFSRIAFFFSFDYDPLHPLLLFWSLRLLYKCDLVSAQTNFQIIYLLVEHYIIVD